MITDKALEAALPGEAEVVELVEELREQAQRFSDPTTEMLTDAADALQAMQARVDKAERERDAFRDMADGYGKHDAELAIAEARVKVLEEALERIDEMLPNPKLPLTHAIKDITTIALKGGSNG